MNVEILTGCTSCHLKEYQPNIWLHGEVLEAVGLLQKNAAQAGFNLSMASGFRSFERQLAIWNAKAAGEKAVFDKHGQRIDHRTFNDEALMWAILRWSALPGTSRHHWGTDMDVWDSAAVAADYRLQLSPEEYTGDGPFEPLMKWLEEQIANGATDFYRPYCIDLGGVMPEPWHLSYQPVARQFSEQLNADIVAELIEGSNIALKEAILDNITEIMHRFVVEC